MDVWHESSLHMNILSYKPFVHTESMQDIKLQADNENEKIMSQFSPLSPITAVFNEVYIWNSLRHRAPAFISVDLCSFKRICSPSVVICYIKSKWSYCAATYCIVGELPIERQNGSCSQ